MQCGQDPAHRHPLAVDAQQQVGANVVARKVGEAWQANPQAKLQMGMTPGLMRWIGQAMQAAGLRFD